MRFWDFHFQSKNTEKSRKKKKKRDEFPTVTKSFCSTDLKKVLKNCIEVVRSSVKLNQSFDRSRVGEIPSTSDLATVGPRRDGDSYPLGSSPSTATCLHVVPHSTPVDPPDATQSSSSLNRDNLHNHENLKRLLFSSDSKQWFRERGASFLAGERQNWKRNDVCAENKAKTGCS